MIIYCGDETFDTNDMLQPAIKDPYVLALYIAKDFSKVYGAFYSRDAGVVVKRLLGWELRNLAQRTGLPELARAAEVDGGQVP